MGSRAVGAALRRRSRDAHPAGDHPRHRRRPRAQGARHRAGRLASQRRPRRVRRPAAHPRSASRGRDRSSRRSTTCGGRRSSRRTRRCRPATTPSRSAWSRRIWPARGARSARYRDAFLALGHYDNGSGPLFNMTALALRTAGFVNGVSQLHGQVTRDMWGPIWPGVANERPSGPRDHQRRARADLAVVGDGARCSTTTCRRTGAIAHDDRGGLGARRAHSGRASCGRRGRRCAPTCSRSSASGRGSAGRTSRSPRRASSPPARCSTRAR